MAPKKKAMKKNKAEINEMTIIVEDSPLNKLNALNGLLEGGNSLSCVSSELTDTSYGPNLLEGLSRMRQESFLCDLVIGTKTKSFDVHKSVMASCSEYFYNILKKDPSTKRVDLNDIAPLGLATVIAYAYTGRLTLSLYTIGSIISAAVYLQIHTLVKMCSDFLIREISVENCMYVVNIAETYCLKNAKATAQKFIRDNFIEFAESEQFMKLTFEQINELLIDDDLQLPSELVAFQIAMKWLEFDPKRVKHAADLLSNIRFGTISAQDLVNYVQTVPRMMQDADCHKLLVDAMNYHLLPYHQNTLQSRRTRIRGGCRVLITVGGRPGLTEKSLSRDILYRDPENGWSKLTEMPAKSFNQCVAVMDGFLYVAGGEDQNDARNQAKHAVSNFCSNTFEDGSITKLLKPFLFNGDLGEQLHVNVYLWQVKAGKQILVEFVKQEIGSSQQSALGLDAALTLSTLFTDSHCRKTFALVPTVKEEKAISPQFFHSVYMQSQNHTDTAKADHRSPTELWGEGGYGGTGEVGRIGVNDVKFPKIQ
ncbi:kelch-like protein 31 [Cricetulus griseus]|uniref:Kelch-like protein 31 n=1 Tax=Cricetulus griseus TaxID=10029 RepID=A0A061I691_CRIGR|nr:kelch-like protein 31 [Cricetulus griseus]